MADLTYSIPENFFNSIEMLLFLLKTLGWVLLGYLIFNIIMLIINFKRYKELKEMREDLKEIKRLVKKK